jgi:hypothetical protein
MDDKEILRARLLSTPRSVCLSIGFAALLAGLIVIRILWIYQQSGKPLGRGIFYAGLISLLIVGNAISLLSKSKFGYVAVMIAGLMPALGSFALSVHALRLLVTGGSAQDEIGMFTSVIGFLQFVTIVALMINLLRREAREWVWTDSAAEVLTA